MECFELTKGLNTILARPGLINTEVIFNGGVSYKSGYCGRYAILYQNAYGGYDTFLLEGNVFKTGKLAQHTYGKAYDNRTHDRETWNYANEITYDWTCTTSWLDDEQSQKLAKHLLSSPDMYLQDLEEDKLIPVIIKPGSYKFKTYKNEGKKLVNYTFTLTESNTQIRQY